MTGGVGGGISPLEQDLGLGERFFFRFQGFVSVSLPLTRGDGITVITQPALCVTTFIAS